MAIGKSEQVKKRGNQKIDLLLQCRMSGISPRLLRHSTKKIHKQHFIVSPLNDLHLHI